MSSNHDLRLTEKKSVLRHKGLLIALALLVIALLFLIKGAVTGYA